MLMPSRRINPAYDGGMVPVLATMAAAGPRGLERNPSH